jgi:hypothetical protein
MKPRDRDNEERQFLEDIERLLRGEEPAGRPADADYMETVLFARKLVELRQEPAEAFSRRLKGNLLTAMASQDAQAQESQSWFMRLFGSPALRLAVVSGFIVLAAIGLVWRAGLLSPAMPQAGSELPGMLTAPSAPATSDAGAPEMARGATDETPIPPDQTAPVPSSLSPLMATVYVAPTTVLGEDISIALVFRNEGPDGYVLAPFPPGVTILETATGRLVRTFAAGTSTSVLSAMESIQYEIIWLQDDDSGKQVQPGRYQVYVEFIEARLEKGDDGVTVGAKAITAFDIVAGAEEDTHQPRTTAD